LIDGRKRGTNHAAHEQDRGGGFGKVYRKRRCGELSSPLVCLTRIRIGGDAEFAKEKKNGKISRAKNEKLTARLGHGGSRKMEVTKLSKTWRRGGTTQLISGTRGEKKGSVGRKRGEKRLR